MCQSNNATASGKQKSNAPCNGSVPNCTPPPPKKNPNVTIGLIVRGNPYVAVNAANAGLPASIPPSKTYEVEVNVAEDLAPTGQFIDLAIINPSADNGNATVSPARIQQTTKVTITGGSQTKPGHAGQLKLEAKLDGAAVKATSAGFSVCAHPIDYTDPYHSDIYTATQLGVRVQDGWSSDSGTFADLNETEISEVVSYVGTNDSPPFTARGAMANNNSGYQPGDQLTVDSHAISRSSVAAGPAGITEALQLCIYKCKRCGTTDIALPNSGFKRVHEVFKVGAQWKHRTKKFGAPVTIGAYVTQAGNANVTSPDHNLP